MTQRAYYDLLAEVDRFDLMTPKAEPAPGASLFDGDEIVGAFAGDHDDDESLTAHVLLENLAVKASGVHALRDLLARTGVDPLRSPMPSAAARKRPATGTSGAGATWRRRSPSTADSGARARST